MIDLYAYVVMCCKKYASVSNVPAYRLLEQTPTMAPAEWPLVSGPWPNGPWRVALAQWPLQEFAPATSVSTGPVSNVPAYRLLEQTPTMAPVEWPLASGPLANGPWRVTLAQWPLQEFAPATSVSTGSVSNVTAFRLLEQTPTMAPAKWPLASGPWRVAPGEWPSPSGPWRVAPGEWPLG